MNRSSAGWFLLSLVGLVLAIAAFNVWYWRYDVTVVSTPNSALWSYRVMEFDRWTGRVRTVYAEHKDSGRLITPRAWARAKREAEE